MSQAAKSPADDQQLLQENERLRERLSALERELVEVQEGANRAIAEWQERAYWLERWHLDLNAVMQRPGAARVRGLLRALRAPLRLARKGMRGIRA